MKTGCKINKKEGKMKLDTELTNEIRKAGKSADFRYKLSDAAKILAHRYEWDSAFEEFGRAIASVCVAVSILHYHPCEIE